MAVAIGTDLPLIELFSPEGEKFSHSVCTSPEAERRLKNTKEGLVHHAGYMEIIAFNLTLPKPFFFNLQEPGVFESFTHVQNKKPHSQGL